MQPIPETGKAVKNLSLGLEESLMLLFSQRNVETPWLLMNDILLFPDKSIIHPSSHKLLLPIYGN